MPVAKLSRKFYEKFGDDLTDELVSALNTIESSYRLELRDLFDAHFGRFEARLEARMDHRLAGLEARFEQRFAEMDVRFERRFASTDLKIEQLRADLHREVVGVMRWNFAAWIPIAFAVVGLYFKP